MKVILCGPIKAWWDCWDSYEHRTYMSWRQELSNELVKAGHLVYRPHEAWKGQWDESAQAVNDMALQVCDVILNLTPEGVPSYGTDDEIDYARRYNKTVLSAPPPTAPRLMHQMAVEQAMTLERDIRRERESLDLAKVARNLLWVIDNGGTGGQAEDFVREARDALGVNTPKKETA